MCEEKVAHLMLITDATRVQNTVFLQTCKTSISLLAEVSFLLAFAGLTSTGKESSAIGRKSL